MESIAINFKKCRVLCLGDVILDRFVYGTIDRISPEAPVPILKMNRDFDTLGGAGNVVHNLSSLGCQVTFIGIVGKDDAGEKAEKLMTDLPNVTACLTHQGRTPLKTRFISLSQQLLRVDDEVIIHPNPATLNTIMTAVQTHLPLAQVVILSDYGKGALPAELCQYVISQAKAAGIPVLVDPKGQDYGRYQGATILTPNAKELSAVARHDLVTDEDFATAALHVKETYDFEAILVTRGSKGMTLIPGLEEASLQIPAQVREVFDVSGAGDTVISTLSAALAVGFPVEDSAKIANIAAGIVVGKVGTAVVTGSELQTACLNAHFIPSKVLSLNEAKDLVQKWHRNHLTVGFTNGCFDLLHLGHLHILEQSKKLCDRLIVGLNSDASVQRLKGDNRPIQGESVRAQVLAALECVDGVVLFDADTPLKLIEALRPDVLCKGADYTVDQVVGADIVQLSGGRVHLINLKPGHSTTMTVTKLRSAVG
jgi:D-beta-D-heptose 7-phosphate kinase / D-beta-D-heptose 1-phosphate adenosyltransferase